MNILQNQQHILITLQTNTKLHKGTSGARGRKQQPPGGVKTRDQKIITILHRKNKYRNQEPQPQQQACTPEKKYK